MYNKVNQRAVNPLTGQRRSRGGVPGLNKQRGASIGTFVTVAFVGWRLFQLLRRAVQQRQQQPGLEGTTRQAAQQQQAMAAGGPVSGAGAVGSLILALALGAAWPCQKLVCCLLAMLFRFE